MALTTGSIAFVGFNADGNDNIAFVALTDINPGEVIFFEDNEWNGTGFNDTNEGAFSWTATSLVSAGTVVRIDNIGFDTITASTGTAATPVTGRGTNRGIAASNEVIYAYTGSAASPTFITAIANSGFSATTGTLTNTGLTVGTNALEFTTGIDIAAYTGARVGGASFNDYRALINNPANWVTQDGGGDQSIDGTAPDVPFSSTAFTTGSTTPTVNLSVNPNTVSEAGQTVITVTATSSSAVTANQTVSLGVSGTNITAGDYTQSDTTITIPSGQTSGSVTFTVVDDALVEGTETAVLTISNPSSGITLGGTTTQNITITDNDTPPVPIITITASSAAAAESSTIVNTGSFTVTRTGDTTTALTVNYTASGTASNGVDYNNLTGSVEILAGQTNATIEITPVNDANATEGNETAILTLVDGANYDLGAASSATVNIADNTTTALKKVGAATGTGAEIPAFDPASDRLFVVAGSTVEIYNVSNAGALAANGSLTAGFTAPSGSEILPNSVAVKNGIVAVAYAIRNTTTGAQLPGVVGFYNAADGSILKSVEVGYLPDMLTFTNDGTRVLTANEGEPNSYNQANSFDPEGSISIINLANGVANATVQTAGFSAFNSQIDALKTAGVRIFGPNATVAQDVEPEYIAFSSDGAKAYVTLQENNAIAIVDIATATVTDIKPLGVKNHNLAVSGIDPSDRDGGINIRSFPVVGLYQPDAIASYTFNGQTYYITANEGDARDYTGFSEEVRVNASSYTLDPTVFPNATTLKEDANLGRLTVTNATGNTDSDTDFDRIEAFGARSFSIWDGSGNLVFDSGDQLERITASQVPSIYNSDGNFTTRNFDSRSDNKGPEPEGVVVGTVNNRTYAFIGLERTGDVIVYEVTDPTNPQFIEYINTPEDVGIEGLSFISAADSPTGIALLVTANEISRTTAVFEFTPPTRISDIQGAAHRSGLVGQTVQNVRGVITSLVTTGSGRGFYIQDPNPDSNNATSEAVFVFMGSSWTPPSGILVGASVQVTGRVDEFRPGNNANNLTITQINGTVSGAAVNQIASLGTITPTVIGTGGRIPPNAIIQNDFTAATPGNVETGGDFDPVTEGIDFYESLEGMLVQINNGVATSPTNNFGETWVLPDNGANATGRTSRGGSLISANDFNPERVQIDDDLLSPGTAPKVNVGATFNTITGVVGYNFNNYEVLPTSLSVASPSTLTKEITTLTGDTNNLTIAAFNVENLDANDSDADKDVADGKFSALAQNIVSNLKSPDIISLEEIQDNNGSTNDGVVDAAQTYNQLIQAITAAGGPTYTFRQINPENNLDGGQPGGNIRVGFLYNPARVTFVDTPGGGATTNTTVTNVGGVPQLSASPGRIVDTNPADGDAFATSRKPLVGEFLFQGQKVFVIGNHFNSKGGDQPLFGPNQPPVLTTEAQRKQQAQAVNDFVDSILAVDPNANIAVVGDLNDFEFSEPLNILKGTPGGAGTPVLRNLLDTIPANERYTYNFQGNAQVLDHMLVSPGLLGKINGYDIVHINSEFADQQSDHDPSVAKFNFTPQPKTTNYQFTNLPKLGTASNGQDILLGGFSGLYFQGVAANGNLKFITHTDRGPNGEPTGNNRPFLLPNFQPEVVNFELNRTSGEISITKRTGLFRQDGTTPLTGLPNLQAGARGTAYTDEQGVDLNNNNLPNDTLGADLEGIVVAENGDMWMVDEYRPAIYRFDSNGKLLERFIPVGDATDSTKNGGTFYGTPVLPAVYAQRRSNRGFEAVALEGTKLYAFIQSPIDNPDSGNDSTSRGSNNLRIVEFDTVGKTVTAEYLYLLDNRLTADKIGDAVALGNGKFAVVERDDNTDAAAKKLIYTIDLAAATNINNPANLTGIPAGKTIEQLTATELAAANIKPVSKSLITNASQAGYTGVDKLEGLALVAPNTLALINDNDFNVSGNNTPIKLGIMELLNNLPVATAGLNKGSDDIFTISGGVGVPKLQVSLTGRTSNLVNELGVVVVDDADGKINGIAPGAAGYAQAALERSKVIFSAIANNPNGFNPGELNRLLQFNNGERLRFYLVRNGTSDGVRSGTNPISDVLFSSGTSQKVTELPAGGFTLSWEDGVGSSTTDFQDLVVKVQQTNQLLPLGVGVQGNPQGEVVDLRGVSGQVKAEFTVNREAAFNNYVGFYRIADVNGGIDVDGNGSIDLLPGDASYVQEAILRRVAGIDLAVNNQGTASITGNFNGGSLFAPFMIVDGRPDAILDSNPNNDPAVLFPFLGANPGSVDHVRLLGNNTFGFEDIVGGGDKDYNDIIVKVNLTAV